MIGPVQAPPQAARALARFVLGRGRGGVSVVATLDESESPRLELLNDGALTAENLEVAWDGGRRRVGDLAPGATTSVPVDLGAEFRCAWRCTARGRAHAWSYEGRHVRGKRAATLDSAWTALYGVGSGPHG